MSSCVFSGVLFFLGSLQSQEIIQEQLFEEIVLDRLYLMADMIVQLENYLLFFLLYNFQIAKKMKRISAITINVAPERKVENLSTEPKSLMSLKHVIDTH